MRGRHGVLLVLAAAWLAGGAARAARVAGDAPHAGPHELASGRLYVPFGAGGEADGSARNLQRSAARAAQGPALDVLYLTAESGAAASRAVKDAAPDGRTLLLARVGNVAIMPALSPRTAVPFSDFTVLAVLDQAPLVCAVRSGSSIGSMRELLAAIAAAPGRLRYSTAGPGTLQSLAVRYLLALSGLPDTAARPVHLGQGTLASQALLDGEVDFSCNNARSVIPLVQTGALRALMTTAQGRLKALPQLQNAAELGLRDMQQLQGWSALLGPAGMPPEAVARWRVILAQVAADPQWQAGTEALGALPRIREIQDPALYLRQQAGFYQRLVTMLGAKP
ncbi:tripartite tricarboxylate transporter substrate binding protein [Roseateles saccharophilus]|uniref:tripartite tricarboxylate transporter substrate binding protein n=1 Tax=Roseateles saccharophilus TaxID=304 RepID=UPI00140432F3|nr:tripartite tricarboxylate transporter substrate binding protein [Roseateles saccharophilus]